MMLKQKSQLKMILKQKVNVRGNSEKKKSNIKDDIEIKMSKVNVKSSIEVKSQSQRRY